ncbi:4-galactosyl-N-acetylglucosaminide 3-alpha-L-fucosyltransferase 9-like isoform X2 [Brachionichthys hirsutus]|uniref:4-galactosyl-N-acetylglucosaminide 3-alpha-L-fucosyltransferase 9-like isoform X2 n=1 Tax=Brachionichthys hirsutus TaxID=412623 RepID=UPI0036043C28
MVSEKFETMLSSNRRRMFSLHTKRRLKLLLVCTFIVGALQILHSIYFKTSTSSLGQLNSLAPYKVKSLCSKKTNNNVITLLVWFWPFGTPFNLTVCKAHYNIEGCFLTADRNLYNKSDGVIIHHQEIKTNLSCLPPTQRPPFQKWIWLNYESPSRSPRIPGIENLFNLTFNYRRDADIKIPYGSIQALDGEQDFVPPRKDKLVCWIVSNWREDLVRVAYYNELRKHIKLHMYGRHFGGRISGENYTTIMTSCKFYLSFENSIHKDYITEKFFKPLSVGTVPVVLGPPRQDYERLIQGDAFIHVDDFASPKELADYLLLLDKNEEMYLKYFEWRWNFKVKFYKYTAWTVRTCLACDHLRRHKEYKTRNLTEYWNE